VAKPAPLTKPGAIAGASAVSFAHPKHQENNHWDAGELMSYQR
jgi:hypothetical protein